MTSVVADWSYLLFMERASVWLLAVEPDCCYKEQRQRECLLKTQSPHSCGRTHAISLHGSIFSCVPLLVEGRVRNEAEEPMKKQKFSLWMCGKSSCIWWVINAVGANGDLKHQSDVQFWAVCAVSSIQWKWMGLQLTLIYYVSHKNSSHNNTLLYRWTVCNI